MDEKKIELDLERQEKIWKEYWKKNEYVKEPSLKMMKEVFDLLCDIKNELNLIEKNIFAFINVDRLEKENSNEIDIVLKPNQKSKEEDTLDFSDLNTKSLGVENEQK